MDIKTSTQGNVAVVEPGGSIDTRASVDFEREIVALLQGGARLIAIDFSKVDLITSSGIRVLVMMTKRLNSINGRVALYGLNDTVKTVFDISGLTDRFLIASSQQDAIAKLAAGTPAEAPKPASKISRLAKRLLGAAPDEAGGRRRGEKSQLSAHVAELLEGRKK